MLHPQALETISIQEKYTSFEKIPEEIFWNFNKTSHDPATHIWYLWKEYELSISMWHLHPFQLPFIASLFTTAKA